MQAGKPGLVKALVVAVATVFTTGITIAQELEDILVTATRREQSLQDVAVSVTAFDSNQIREMGFVNTVDIVQMTPGLNYTVPNAAGSQINFFMRGVGLNDFADAQENPVAVYVDDAYRPAMGGLHQQLFDVERVEILRGPQGALFGRNTTGGVVHFITKRPTDEVEGYVDATYGDYEQIKVEGAVSLPIVKDTLLSRVSAGYHTHDGYTENRFRPNAVATNSSDDYNEADTYALRGQLLYKPTDDIEALLIGYYTDADSQVGAWQHQATRPASDPTDPNANLDVSVPLGGGTNPWCDQPGFDFGPGEPGKDCFGFFGGIFGVDEVGFDPDGDPWEGNYDRDGSVEIETKGATLDFNWALGELNLTSITSYYDVDRSQEEDTEMGPLPLLIPTFKAETETWSQEIRLSKDEGQFRWLGGFYYFDNDVDGDYTLDTTPILDFVLLSTPYEQETDSWALFGNVEYDFNDQWTVSAGLRYTDETKELDLQTVDSNGVLAALAPTPIASYRPTPDFAVLFNRSSVGGQLAEFDEDYWTGDLKLNFKPNDDVLLYASYARGVKSAGFNSGFVDITGVFAANIIAPLTDPICSDSSVKFRANGICTNIPFDKEEVDAYEIGLKSTVFGGTTRINAAGFYYDYQNLQVLGFQFFNQVIFNADAEMTGAELEIQTTPLEGLDLQLGVSYLDSEADDIPNRDTGSLNDRDPVSAPEWTVNAMARYEWPVQALRGNLALMVWGNYQDETYFDILNHPSSRENGYTVWNVRGEYTTDDGRLQLAAFLKNAGDEEYKTYTFDFTVPFGFNQQAFGEPQWWGVSARYNFGGL